MRLEDLGISEGIASELKEMGITVEAMREANEDELSGLVNKLTLIPGVDRQTAWGWIDRARGVAGDDSLQAGGKEKQPKEKITDIKWGFASKDLDFYGLHRIRSVHPDAFRPEEDYTAPFRIAELSIREPGGAIVSRKILVSDLLLNAHGPQERLAQLAAAVAARAVQLLFERLDADKVICEKHFREFVEQAIAGVDLWG